MNKYLTIFSILSVISIASCTDDNTTGSNEREELCTQSVCDGNQLLFCHKEDGKITIRTCENGCKKGKCIEADAPRCSKDICKDENTLIKCDRDTGNTSEKTCEDGCENNACRLPADACEKDICKDEHTLIKCDKGTGNTSEKTCENGCENDACRLPADACEKDICKDENTLIKCDKDTGNTSEKTCEEGCENDACRLPADACEKDICKDENTLIKCDRDTGNTSEEPCPNGCMDNACAKPPACKSDICKDENTLSRCNQETGIAVEEPCPDGCKDNACVEPGCKSDVCTDENTLARCDTTSGTVTNTECKFGCSNNACLEYTVTPEADLMDLAFYPDGSIRNLTSQSFGITQVVSSAVSTYFQPSYKRYAAHFNNPLGGTPKGFYKIDYSSNSEFQNAIKNGHSLEAVFRLGTAHDGSNELKFFSSHQSGGTGFLISKTDHGKDITFLPYVGGAYIWTSSGIQPEVGRYYHVVGVWNKSEGKSYIYVDGELKKTASAAGDFSFGSLKWFGVGADPAESHSGQSSWNGDVVIARVYDSPLNQTQVTDLYKKAQSDGLKTDTITVSTALGDPKLATGYKYHIYGDGFKAGDVVQFTSANGETFICETTISDGKITATIPAGITTGYYNISVIRDGKEIALTSASVTAASNPPNQYNIKTVAHRGYHPDSAHPENSIASLKYAQELGVYGAEFDVWITLDGGLFVNHDGKLNNVSIQNSNTSTVQGLKLSNGEAIPTLRAYLEQGKKVPGVKMILEIKTHGAVTGYNAAENNKRVTAACIALVKELQMEEQVEWIAFSYDNCKQIREALPNAVVQYLSGDKAPSAMVADRISALDYSQDSLTENWIQEAHGHHMFVNVWTVGKSNFTTWINRNVDVITTNDAEDLMKISKICVEK